MDEKVQLWLEKAEYDVVTAKAMLDTGRYNYVAFMSQQAIDKVPIKTHNLVFLAKKIDLQLDEDTEDFLESLFIDYMTVRYPDVGEHTLNDEQAKELYEKSMEVFLWLKITS